MAIGGMGAIGSFGGGGGQTPVGGGGGSAGGAGGGMGGGMWGMVAQFAMQELDREREDRAALFQGLKQAVDPNSYIMAHYPNFYSTPQVQTQSVANPNPNAPSQQAANMSGLLQGAQSNQGAMQRQQGSQEFDKWKMGQEDVRTQKYMDWIGGMQGNNNSNLSPEEIMRMKEILGR